jgi:hypothetical protein
VSSQSQAPTGPTNIQSPDASSPLPTKQERSPAPPQTTLPLTERYATSIVLAALIIAITVVSLFLYLIIGASNRWHDAPSMADWFYRKSPWFAFLALFAALSGALLREAARSATISTWLARGVNSGFRQAGPAVLAVLSIIGTLGLAGHFLFGSHTPQVMLIGSGTVHRFLFSHPDGLALPMGEPIGSRDLRFWALEGESHAGLDFSAYAYFHGAQHTEAADIPIIGMASFHAFEVGDRVRPLLANIEAHLKTNNPNDRFFVLLPLLTNVPVTAYIHPSQGCNIEEARFDFLESDISGEPQSPRLDVRWSPGQRIARQCDVSLFTGGRGSGTAQTQKPPRSGDVPAAASSMESFVLPADPQFNKTPLPRGVHSLSLWANFSLDLSQLSSADPRYRRTTLVATGNFAKGFDETQQAKPPRTGEWYRTFVPHLNGSDTRRDLFLVVPVQTRPSALDPKEGARLPRNACLAISEIEKRVASWRESERGQAILSSLAGSTAQESLWSHILDLASTASQEAPCTVLDKGFVATGKPDWTSTVDK